MPEKNNRFTTEQLEKLGYHDNGTGTFERTGKVIDKLTGRNSSPRKEQPVKQQTDAVSKIVVDKKLPQQRKMNRLEARYAKEVLEPRKLIGEVIRWDYEPEKLRLADSTYYTPDFRVILSTGEVQFHETKGYWEEDARIKIKVAAVMHPYQFIAVQYKDKKWDYEYFKTD